MSGSGLHRGKGRYKVKDYRMASGPAWETHRVPTRVRINGLKIRNRSSAAREALWLNRHYANCFFYDRARDFYLS